MAQATIVFNSLVAITDTYVDVDVTIHWDGVTANQCPRAVVIWVDVYDIPGVDTPHLGSWSGHFVGLPASAWWGVKPGDLNDDNLRNYTPPLFVQGGGAQDFDGVLRLPASQPLSSFSWDDIAAAGATIDARVVLADYQSSIFHPNGTIFPLTVPDVPPESIPCSLVITSINITNESDIGAADGSAVINVGGAQGAVTYQKDSGTPSSSNTISGLTAGNYLITVQDAAGCTFQQNITVSVIGSTTTVMEQLLIEVRPTPCAPVFLCWLNSLDSWDSYCFEDKTGVFETEIKTSIAADFERYIEDLATDTNNTGITTKIVERSLKIGADNIDADIFIGLVDLFTSPAVFLLVNRFPITWQSVRVSPGTLKYSEHDHTIEIVLELPNMFIQRS